MISRKGTACKASPDPFSAAGPRRGEAALNRVVSVHLLRTPASQSPWVGNPSCCEPAPSLGLKLTPPHTLDLGIQALLPPPSLPFLIPGVSITLLSTQEPLASLSVGVTLMLLRVTRGLCESPAIFLLPPCCSFSRALRGRPGRGVFMIFSLAHYTREAPELRIQ